MLLLSAVLFGTMAFLAKIASRTLPGSQVAMLRFVLGLAPVVFIPSIRRAALRYERADLLFYRGFFGGVAVLLYFMAIERIPVGVATLLNYTAPVFSGIFAAVFIGEPIRRTVLLPLLVAFAGVVCVVKAHAGPGEIVGFGIWEMFGLLSAVLSGAAVTAIRVARRSESSWAIYGSFSLFGALATAPVALWEWRTPTLGEWQWLAAVALVSLAAQLAMTHALKWVDTVTSGVIHQFAIVVATAYGALFLGEKLTSLSILGSTITVVGVVGVIAITSDLLRGRVPDQPDTTVAA